MATTLRTLQELADGDGVVHVGRTTFLARSGLPWTTWRRAVHALVAAELVQVERATPPAMGRITLTPMGHSMGHAMGRGPSTAHGPAHQTAHGAAHCPAHLVGGKGGDVGTEEHGHGTDLSVSDSKSYKTQTLNRTVSVSCTDGPRPIKTAHGGPSTGPWPTAHAGPYPPAHGCATCSVLGQVLVSIVGGRAGEQASARSLVALWDPADPAHAQLTDVVRTILERNPDPRGEPWTVVAHWPLVMVELAAAHALLLDLRGRVEKNLAAAFWSGIRRLTTGRKPLEPGAHEGLARVLELRRASKTTAGASDPTPAEAEPPALAGTDAVALEGDLAFRRMEEALAAAGLGAKGGLVFARREWWAVWSRPDRPKVDVVLAGLARAARAWRGIEWRFVPNLSTWIAKRGWDEPDAPAQVAPAGFAFKRARELTPEEQAREIAAGRMAAPPPEPPAPVATGRSVLARRLPEVLAEKFTAPTTGAGGAS